MRVPLLLAVVCLLGACSSSESPASSATPTASAGAGGGADGGAAGQPAGGAGGAGGAAAGGAGQPAGGAAGQPGGAAGQPAAGLGGITREGNLVTVTMDSFTVAPGEEVYRCQNYANPFGADVDVERFESEMTQGSHHLLFFYQGNAKDAPVESCSGLEFHASPYSTQLPSDSVEYPAGVAARVKQSDGFRVQSHYLNTTDQPITALVQVRLRLAAQPVAQQAGVLFMVQPDFSIPPGTKQTVTRHCKLPMDASVILASGHMHRHGVGFVASIAGQTIHQTDSWSDPPPTRYTPPISFKKGDSIDFSCTFQNNESVPLTFGESAFTNEMCIANVQFFPLPAGSPATIDCDLAGRRAAGRASRASLR
jgi:hypothetical protein